MKIDNNVCKYHIGVRVLRLVFCVVVVVCDRCEFGCLVVEFVRCCGRVVSLSYFIGFGGRRRSQIRL